MPSYRVCHSDSGATFFLVAENPKDAVEIVTMRVGSASGKTAWEAKPQPAPFELRKGRVYDSDGRAVPDVML